MSGRLNGVQKLFRDEVLQAIYVHCYNHKLNLVIADICKNISDVKLFFDLVEEIYVFVSGSAVHSLFVDIQKKINLHSVVELKKICLTIWTAQVFATLALKKILSPLLIVLHKLINDKGDRSVTAKGLLHQIDFIFVLNLVVFSNILTMFKKVSDFLQGVIAEMSESMVLIKSLIMTLKNMRNDSNDCLNECDGSINYICFEKMCEEALYICRENNIPLPSEQIQNIRKKRVPQKFKSFFIDENISLENEQAQSKNYFRTKLFLPILDKIINELENQFSINSNILYVIDYLHPKNAKFLSYDDLKPLAQHYKLDTELLKSELKIIPNTINMYQKENKIKITNLMNFIDLLEKQTLPVVPKGTRTDEVKSCLIRSNLWPQINILKLLKNMRVYLGEEKSAGRFADLLLEIGNGNYPSFDEMITIPENPMEWLCEHAILTPKNDQAAAINATLLMSFEEEEKVYTLIDTVVNIDDATNVEFLNSLKPQGMLYHRLILRVDIPIMLLRNLKPPKLCNGIRLKVKALHLNIVETTILTGWVKGETVFVPRIPLIPNDHPFEFKRLQFPLKICFAMTINESQGQTLKFAGIDLRENCFSHGQFYVACSPSSLLILSPTNRSAKNIVDKEILQMTFLKTISKTFILNLHC
ncbi:hypothetical protein QTP88_017045 [Uroleucon formosanum]